MVYRKYIKRGGKLFGPYYYRSVKKEGKVITQYVKNPQDFPQKKLLPNSKRDFTKLLIFSVILLSLILVFFLVKPVFTGKVILSIENTEVSGETLSGNLKLNLEPNEFIPASTKVLIENNNKKYEFVLSELIKEEPKSEREFYVSGTEISGFGEGYGVNDEDLEVSFILNILSEKNPDGSNEIIPNEEGNFTEAKEEQKTGNFLTSSPSKEGSQTKEENISEIPEQNETENTENQSLEVNGAVEAEIPLPEETTTKTEVIEENPELSGAQTENPEPEITSSAILNFFNNIFLTITGKTSLKNNEKIAGKVSKNKPFIYAIKQGQTTEITESDKRVDLEIINNTAVITTEYSGEGKEYIINLSELNISVKDNNLNIKLIYNKNEIYSINKNLNFENKTNQTIQEANFTLDNSTIQYGAVLWEPVKWKKKVIANEQNTIVELPVQAENISVYTLKGTSKIENSAIEPVAENLNASTTGNIILKYKSDGKGFFSKVAKFITGRVIEVTEKSEKIEVNISENGIEYEIEYITPAPISFEKETPSGKEVIISSEVHYENVLAYTSLPENTNLREIKLYQITDGSYSEGHKKIPVDFIAYNNKNEIVEESDDLDDDVLAEIEEIVNKKDEAVGNKSLIYGEENKDNLNYSVKKIRAQKENLVSRIEWIVPSLSNQTYELILITKAQHLDSSKNFISDIYDAVKELDGNWSEPINKDEYVRVTFEKNLTSENDITIFPRTISPRDDSGEPNGTLRIEVYENNKTEIIAEFTNIIDNEYNKVYLTKLNSTQNTFDLKILGGSVEFEHIIDPIILGNANSVNANTTYENNFTHLNISNSSIVLYMPFDENVSTTTTYDYTNDSYDGTLFGNTVYNTSQGIYGGFYTFDGSGDWINASDINELDGIGAMTISLWIKLSALAVDKDIISKFDYPSQNSFIFQLDSVNSDEMNVYISSALTDGGSNYGTTTNANIVANTWYNTLFVFDGSKTNNSDRLNIYVDGVKKSITYTGTIPATLTSSLAPVEIGRLEGFPLRDWNGDMDEVMIWNTALNSTEVLALYNNQTSRFHGTGEMEFRNLNFGGNSTINISLNNFSTNMGSSLRARINNGTYRNFDNTGLIKDYNATGNLTNANLTIGFVGGNGTPANTFYTPLIIGNITLQSTISDLISPNISFANPTTNATNLSQNFIFANLSFADATSSISMANISLFNSTQNIINSTQGTTSTLEINFTGLADGTYYLNASVNDTLGNRNQTETRKIILDTTAPTFTINNPNESNEETGNPILYSITTNEASACQVITDSGSRKYLNSSDGNLTHTASFSLSNDYHTANFYCNDTLNNGETNASVRFFVRVVSNYPSTLGGGGTPTFSSTTIIGALLVNFTNMSINTPQSNFYIDFKNKINIQTFDNKGNLIDVDKISVNLTNKIGHNINIFGKGKGKYVVEADIFELKPEILKFDIIATQGDKTIMSQFEISIAQKDFKEILEDKVQKSIEYINKNRLLFLIFIITALIFIIILFLIFRNKKKNKKDEYSDFDL